LAGFFPSATWGAISTTVPASSVLGVLVPVEGVDVVVAVVPVPGLLDVEGVDGVLGVVPPALCVSVAIVFIFSCSVLTGGRFP
jgi:hypothetical protein